MAATHHSGSPIMYKACMRALVLMLSNALLQSRARTKAFLPRCGQANPNSPPQHVYGIEGRVVKTESKLHF